MLESDFFFTDDANITMEPKEPFHLNVKKIRNYINSITELGTITSKSERFSVRQFKYGQSNPTYLIIFNNLKLVLRKAPPNNKIKNAHQVEREAMIMKCLWEFDIPVPRIYSICTDTSVLGAVFYIMEHIDGIIFRKPSLPSLPPETKRAVYESVTSCLSQIHSINYVELIELQKLLFPGVEKPPLRIFQNYCSKQLKLWASQYQILSKINSQEFPTLNNCSKWLSTHIASLDIEVNGRNEGDIGGNGIRSGGGLGLVHGDFRIDNIIFDKNDHSKILAVIDWELSSLGNPLCDLAHFCLPYYFPCYGILQDHSLLQPHDVLVTIPENDSSNNSNNSTSIIFNIFRKPPPPRVHITLSPQPQPQSQTSSSSPSSFPSSSSFGSGWPRHRWEGIPQIEETLSIYQYHRSYYSTINMKLQKLQNINNNSTNNINSNTNDINKNTNRTMDTGLLSPGSSLQPPLLQLQQPSIMSPDQWLTYLTLSLYRLAVITMGVQARSILGNAAQQSSTDNHITKLEMIIPVFGEVALKLIELHEQRQSSSATKTASSTTTSVGNTNTPSSLFRKRVTFQDPDPSMSPRAQELLKVLRRFIIQEMIPAEKQLLKYYTNAQGKWPQRGDRWTVHPLLHSLAARARDIGLWNLWLPEDLCTVLRRTHPDWPWHEILPLRGKAEGLSVAPVTVTAGKAEIVGNDGDDARLSDTERKDDLSTAASPTAISVPKDCCLSNYEYAQLAIATGYCLWTPEVLNCSAPDTGNMEIIGRFGTSLQRNKYLLPLLAGDTRSCFAMTEPNVASSDPVQLCSSAILAPNQKEWILNGHKWWTTGACDPRCDVCIFVAKTNETHDSRHHRHSLFLVPMTAEGLTVVQPLTVFGYDDAPHGHAEIKLENVVVDGSCMLGGEGKGFYYCQARLGPGRLHHCCRMIGHGERALVEAMSRATSRKAFGKNLLELGGNAERITAARIQLYQAKLAVLRAAQELDTWTRTSRSSPEGAAGVPMSDSLMQSLAIAKIVAPQAAQTCLDLAIQLHGGEGLSANTPLAAMWASARSLRLVDGPDEVHIRTLSRIDNKELLAYWDNDDDNIITASKI